MLDDSIPIYVLVIATLILPPILYLLASSIYNLTLHPLRKIPGPFFSKISTLPLKYHKLRGISPFWIHSLHHKYGAKVRLAPNEISFISYEAWKDIYGHRSAGKPSFQKHMLFYGPDLYTPKAEGGIIRANDVDHARQRRLCSAAFSDKSLKEQEPLLRRYVDLLIIKLQDLARKEGNDALIDIVRWFNYTTFDIMSDLTFGEKMGLLDNSSYSDWVASVFSYIKFVTFNQVAREIPILDTVLPKLIPKSMIQKRKEHAGYSSARVDKRLKTITTRPDVWTQILRFQDSEKHQDRGLTIEEMYSISSTFMTAGTETTATLLSGLIYLLLQHPDKKHKLVKEVRNAFPTQESITIASLLELKYLNACLEEALRVYPPVASGMPRVTPPGGAVVCGEYLAPGVIAYVSHYAAYHSPTNFYRPDEFLPERWLKASGFEEDNKQILQPFSFGPRNCLGKNLAYHEMRLILSSILWNFDLSPCDEVGDWMPHKAYVIWEKPPLMVRLTARN